MKRLALSLLLFLSTLAYSGESVIHPFQGAPDGALPLAGLVADSSGNLYGTTSLGGSGPCQSGVGAPHGCGTIFEVSPDGHGGWTEVILYSFQGGKDGEYPGASLAVDNLGNLYGVTAGGGNPCPPSCGNIFELANDGTFTVLFTFKGNSHGGVPGTGLTLDSDGRLYGTTAPLASDNGSVFQFANGKIKTLHTFVGGTDGVFPKSTPIFGPDGNLYGVTGSGGANNAGTLYRLSFGTKWHYKVVYSFPASFGGPRDNLAFDATGNLYGVTYDEHVFQLKQSKNGKWSGKSIHKFSPFSRQGDGTNVRGGVAIDASGNIYGLTASGTAKKGYGDGVIYELVPNGTKWAESILYAFGHGGSDGFGPTGQVILGSNSALFGITQGGGSGNCGGSSCGTVFEFAP